MYAIEMPTNIGLRGFLERSEADYDYEACRDRLLVAISVTEAEGYYATRDALIDLLKELEASKCMSPFAATHD